MSNGVVKAYDIRGIYPFELDEITAWSTGWGLGRYLTDRTPGPVVVGRDMRQSSEVLSQALTAGLNA